MGEWTMLSMGSAAGAMLLVVASAAALLRPRWRDGIVAYWQERGLRPLIEVAIALPLLAAGLWLVQSTSPLSGGTVQMVALGGGAGGAGSLDGPAVVVILLLTLPIALMVLVRRRWVVPAWGLVMLGIGYVVMEQRRRLLDEVMANAAETPLPALQALMREQLFVTTPISLARQLPVALIGLAVGVLALRWRLPWWVAAPMAAATMVAGTMLTTPAIEGDGGGIVPVILGALVFHALLLGLPVHRAQLLHHLSPSPEGAGWPMLPGRVVAVGALSVALMALPFYTMLSRHEAEVLRVIGGGAPPVLHDAGQVNAWPILREQYRRTGPGAVVYTARAWPAAVARPVSTANGDLPTTMPLTEALYSPELALSRGAMLSPAVRTEIQLDIDHHAGMVELLRRVRHADYIGSHHAGRDEVPSYLALRELSRHLARVATMHSHDGRHDEARETAELCLVLGLLLNDGNLVDHMVGTAIRGIALATLECLLIDALEDEAALRALAAVLETHRHRATAPFPLDNLRHHEPGLRAIVPFAEIALPSFNRAVTIHHRTRARHQMLRLAAAAAIHRRQHGQWPADEAELAAALGQELPLDSFTGKAFVYTVTGDEMTITTAPWMVKQSGLAPMPIRLVGR